MKKVYLEIIEGEYSIENALDQARKRVSSGHMLAEDTRAFLFRPWPEGFSSEMTWVSLRVFDSNTEIRMEKSGNGMLHVRCLSDVSQGEEYLVREQEYILRQDAGGKVLCTQEYFQPNEDGMLIRAGLRLSGVKGERP